MPAPQTGNPLLDMLGFGGSLGFQGLGGVLGGNIEEWWRNAAVNAFNTSMANLGGIYNQYQPQLSSQREYAMRLLDPSTAHINNWLYGMTDQFAQRPDQITQLFRDSGMYQTPEMNAAQLALGNAAGQMGPIGQLAGQGFAGGGWTPQYQQLFDRGFDILGGAGPAMGSMLDVGPNLLGMRGQNQFTMNTQARMMDAINQGGMNPYLQALGGTGMGLMQNPRTPGLDLMGQLGAQGAGGMFGVGGLTPTGATGEAVALEGLLRGGGTPTTDILQGRGSDLALREALLPMGTAISAAGDMAANQAIAQYEAAQRRAEARGGGPGPVRGGLQNQGMAEYADAAARLVADSERQAMMQQQGLQLQQMGMGAGMAGQAGGLEAGRLGTFGDILRGLEGTANQRFGIGGGMLTDSERIALQRLSTGMQGVTGMQGAANDVIRALSSPGIAGMQAEIARMGLGGDLSNMFTQNQLGALGTLGNIAGNQNQYALGLGGLGIQAPQAMGNLYNQQFGNWLGAGQLGVNRANMIGNQWLGADQNRLNQMGQVQNQWTQAMNPFNQVSQQLNNLAQNWIRGATGAFSNAGPMNPWANLGG
jgi:hypothetical protein